MNGLLEQRSGSKPNYWRAKVGRDHYSLSGARDALLEALFCPAPRPVTALGTTGMTMSGGAHRN